MAPCSSLASKKPGNPHRFPSGTDAAGSEQSGVFYRRIHDAWDVMTAGERARLLHSRWLTEALRSGKEMPRIPLRRADEGGWDDLLSKPKGRDVAERWWRRALRWVEWE